MAITSIEKSMVMTRRRRAIRNKMIKGRNKY
jgi:hypothetical protein